MVVLNSAQERYSNNSKVCGPSRTTWPPAWLRKPSPEVELAAPLLPEVEPVSEVKLAASDAKHEAHEPEAAHDDDDVIELDWTEIVPCPTCGLLEKWWSMTGQERCLNCEFPSRAMYFMQRASRFASTRKRERITGP
jgi:hypothetical protein